MAASGRRSKRRGGGSGLGVFRRNKKREKRRRKKRKELSSSFFPPPLSQLLFKFLPFLLGSPLFLALRILSCAPPPSFHHCVSTSYSPSLRFNGGKFSFVRPFKFVGRGLSLFWRRLVPLSIPRPRIESRDSVRVVLGLAEQSPHPPGCKIRQIVAR